MSTFADLQKQSRELTDRKLILAHLVDYLESTFRVPSKYGRKVLLNENKVPVEDAAFDDVIVTMLKEIKDLDLEVKNILSMTISTKGESK